MLVHALLIAAAPFRPAADTVPLYTTLGTHHYAVRTTVPLAQRYFDQGLRLYYAFNHAEAVRAFREAERLDPACAMCAWGEALALGPNINAPMDSASEVQAHAAVQRALARRGNGSAVERGLIAALATRYRATPGGDRAAFDSAYATAMAALAGRFPREVEVAVLAAEAGMDLRPWNYWARAAGNAWTAAPGMGVVQRLLDRAIVADSSHPGACHFYIHFAEEAYPERAVACAERLANAMPGAGHLVHMPGHIYIRVGRYDDAIRVNQHAVHADESYIRDQRPGFGTYTAGYYPHNYDFLAFAAAMAGREALAIEAADKLAGLATPYMIGPGMTFAEHHVARQLQMRVRFGRWEEILALPAPPAEAPYLRAIRHYARGRALVAAGSDLAAAVELDSLRRLAADQRLAGVRVEFNPASEILAVAVEVLAGHLLAARDDHPGALRHLEAGVRAEGALKYGEPLEWSIPVRQELGAMLLAAGRPAEAARVYREDLAAFPKNVWSERGLTLALRGQR
jgi:tetratricopeptide (TPR) repeat protein